MVKKVIILLTLSVVMGCTDMKRCVKLNKIPLDLKVFHKTNNHRSNDFIPKILEDKNYYEYSFSKSIFNKDESHRARIQQNFYYYPLSIDMLNVKFNFEMDEWIDKYLASNNEIEWLTISEVWNDPGWIKSENPFRVTFNLIKKSQDDFFLLKVEGQMLGPKNWKNIWRKQLRLKVVPKIMYSLEYNLNVSNDKLNIYFSNGVNRENMEVNEILHHPNLTNDNDIWGLNPIKLYTNNENLNAMDKYSSGIKIKFVNPQFCFVYN